MNHFLRKIGYLLTLAVVLLNTGCKDEVLTEITELETDRLFSPIGIEAKVINQTQVVVSWTKNELAETYSLEVFENDSLTFAGSPVLTVNGITNLDIPYTISSGLIGQTNYSIRIKAIGVEIDESKWNGVFVQTGSEQIMQEIVEADVTASQVTVKWPAGETATNIIVTGGASPVDHSVTPAEIAAGSAVVTGLTEDTAYEIRLMKDDKIRGTRQFSTLMDLTAAGTVVVATGEDLAAAITAAAPGTRIVINPTNAGDEFLPGGANIDIDKAISIRGYLKSKMPVVHAQFLANTNDAALTVRDVILDGLSEGVYRDHVVQLKVTGVDAGEFIFRDCVITNYNKSLVSGASGIAVSIAAFDIINSKVSNVLTNSADCIDVRGGCIISSKMVNSTFNNVAPARDFYRLDDASAAFVGKSTTVEVDRCTFYGVSNNASRRLLYIRFADNNVTFKNSLVLSTLGYHSNQNATNVSFENNYYFEAPNFKASAVTNSKLDETGVDLTAAPAVVGDDLSITIVDQDLLSKGVGAVINW